MRFVASQALYGGRSDPSGNEELVEQEHHVGILPGIAADPCPIVTGTQLPAFDVPLVSLSVTLRILEACITLGPLGDSLSVKESLLANNQSALSRCHVPLYRLNHPFDVCALVC